MLSIPHDPVALEEHFRDDDDGPVSSQGYMPYLNKYILDKVIKIQLYARFIGFKCFEVKDIATVFSVSVFCCFRLWKALLIRKMWTSFVGLLQQRKTTRLTKTAALSCQKKMLFGYGVFLIFCLRTNTL